jgi:lipopolysaccharide export LptBFGC system permease protein LptF
MANAQDWNDRKVRVQDQYIVQLPALITNFERNTRSLGDLVNQVQKLEDEKGQLDHEIMMAEQGASTADREFIERKQQMPDPFKPSKVSTLQDFTFLLFFLSYCIFIVALSMVSERKSAVFGGGLLALLFIVVLLYKYI